MPIRYWLPAVAAVFLGMNVACAPRQPSEQALAAAMTWQARTCSVDGDKALEEILVRNKNELEPFFLDALERGPSATLIGQVEAAADQQYRKQHALMETGERFGLKAPDLQLARAGTHDEYVGRQRTAFVNRYQSQAVAALGLLDGRRGRERLTALAADRNSPLQSSARAALKR